MIRKQSKRPERVLRAKARKIFAKWIVLRDRGVCFTCGRPGNQAGHFVHKDCLDFDEEANNCQCTYCNLYQRGNLGEYAVRLIKKIGIKKVDAIFARGHQVRKFTLVELENIIKDYGERIKNN